MKYFIFDSKSLIADYKRNENAMQIIEAEILYAKRNRTQAIDEQEKNDWQLRIKLYELKKEEYKHYIDMVVLGFGAISEIERKILEMWLLENKDERDISKGTGITLSLIPAAKNKALRNFESVVNPI